jgi:predicted regulator of Ras-like GTPase activity (Roadblock/LC7/MglB family)
LLVLKTPPLAHFTCLNLTTYQKIEKDLIMAISTEKLSGILQNFVTSTNDVQGAAVVTPDGLPLATSLPGAMDEERVSAMSAAMLSLGERIGNELARGTIDRIYVEGNQGYGVLTSCGEDAVFLVLANQSAKQGLLMLEIKRALAELKLVLM